MSEKEDKDHVVGLLTSYPGCGTMTLSIANSSTRPSSRTKPRPQQDLYLPLHNSVSILHKQGDGVEGFAGSERSLVR